MATGGLTVGKSHAEGGIPMTVKDTGQKIEVEGGEIIINKKSASDTKKHTFDGQKLTKCEIASKINESDGNGVKIDCDSIEGKKYKFKRGGKTQQLNELFEDYYKRGGFVNFIYPKDSLGFEKHELPQIRTGAKGMFAEYLDNKYKRPMTSQIIVKASTLKPVQNKINTKQLEKIEEYGGLKKGKPITISNDGYVIDGHHRWYYATQKGLSLPALRIDLPATKVIEESFNSGLAEKESIESVRGAFADGGKISREYSTKEIPINLYRSFFQDTDSDGVPNVDDVAPFNPNTKEKLEEVSLSDEMRTIIDYRNDFEKIRKQVVNDLEKITVECDAKGDCGVLSRTKTPYSIINKLRRRSLTNVKDLDKLDEKAKQKLKEKDLTGLDLYKGLTDVVGAMVVTPDKKNADKIRDVINSGRLGRVLEFEDFYKNDNNGYRAYHFLIAIEKDGKVYPVEIQVKTKRVKRLAGLSHTVYKNGNLNAEGFDKLNQLALKSDMGDVKAQKEFDEIVSNRKKVMGMIAKKTMAKGGEVSVYGTNGKYYLKKYGRTYSNPSYKTKKEAENWARLINKGEYKLSNQGLKYIEEKNRFAKGGVVKVGQMIKYDDKLLGTGSAKVKSIVKAKPNKEGITHHYITNKGVLSNQSLIGSDDYKKRFAKGGSIDLEKQLKENMDKRYEFFLKSKNDKQRNERAKLYHEAQEKYFEYKNRFAKGGLVELKSVGSLIDVKKGLIYPQYENGKADFSNPISLRDEEVSSDWYESLSPQDYKVVNQATNFAKGGRTKENAFVVMYKVKKDIENRNIAPTQVAYKNQNEAQKFLDDIEKEGGKGMIVKSKMFFAKGGNIDLDSWFVNLPLQKQLEITGLQKIPNTEKLYHELESEFYSYPQQKRLFIYKKYKSSNFAKGGILENLLDGYDSIYQYALANNWTPRQLAEELKFMTNLGNKGDKDLYDFLNSLSDMFPDTPIYEFTKGGGKMAKGGMTSMQQMRKKYEQGGMITGNPIEKLIYLQLQSLKEGQREIEQGLREEPLFLDDLNFAYNNIPPIYTQDGKGKNAVVYLHYFNPSSDWYITELDKENNEGYGYAILNGDTQFSEFGYIPLDQFTEQMQGVNPFVQPQLDQYFKPQTLNQIFQSKYPELVSGEVEIYEDKKVVEEVKTSDYLSMDFKNPYERNIVIRNLIDEKGDNADNYTVDEKEFIQLYSGMGGLEKFGAKEGLLYEYYTPKDIVQKMWGLAFKHKLGTQKIETCLEPSVATGNFVGYAPENVKMIGYDIDKYAYSICNVLYGNNDMHEFYNMSFEKLFINNRNKSVKDKVEPFCDLVIGNPPYGKYSGIYAGMGEKDYTKANDYIDYFIFRSLDLLKSGGLLVFIIGKLTQLGGKRFTDQISENPNDCQMAIRNKSNLVDAYRLPVGVFDTTEVESEIIVLRKK